MDTQNPVKGLAFLCNLNGIIIKILRDDFNLNQTLTQKLFANVVDEPDRGKALNFLLEVKLKNIAFDYQLNIVINNEIITLYFVGIVVKDSILVIGADNHKEALEFTNNLQQITNEQANLIRKLIKGNATEIREKEQENSYYFDELTRLNNELVNLQRELSKKNSELARLNNLKNQFLGMAAHDLRNPLGVIQSYAEFLIDEIAHNLSDEHRRFLHTIYKSTNFMLGLIEDLLDISIIESGNISLNKEDFDMVAMVSDNIDLNRVLAAKKQIEIHLETQPGILMVTADKQKIEQVLNNLISNAIKFSPPNSSIYVVLRSDLNQVSVKIKDHGIGIKSENLEKLFNPFVKFTEKGTQGEKGTGLGLTIARKIVESHNGHIEVSSIFGKGTIFVVSLPILKPF